MELTQLLQGTLPSMPTAFIAGLGFQEMLIIGLVLLIFFGGGRMIRALPKWGKDLGEGIRETKKALRSFNDESEGIEDELDRTKRELAELKAEAPGGKRAKASEKPVRGRP